ncbi:MAG TPA: OmpA family protein [Arenimonas sp.]|nr:OmpA family protein [Arenimonas sp.]
MNKKILCGALLAATGLAQSAMAQEFDDRWYLTGGIGAGVYDNSRNTDNALFGTVGFGSRITQRIALDTEFHYGDPDQWELLSLSSVARIYFGDLERDWQPYLALGLGGQRHKEDLAGPNTRRGTELLAIIGAGLETRVSDNWAFRTEVSGRHDRDDGLAGAGKFFDWHAGVSLKYSFGDLPEPPAPPPPPPPPPAPTCADLDGDNDGVNNCDDKCPDTVAGTVVGPDGCAVPLTIDLKGVNFDFDKSVLRPDAVAILAEAVEILKKYPQMRVEVAGHTDSTGPEAYNQKLSERRAAAVHEYLTGNGVDASRLVGPVGYGELRPIDSNDTREGRARNRRTELNVQN